MTLSKFAHAWRDPDPEGSRNAAAQLWQGQGILVIFPTDVHGLDKDWVKAFGNRVYGGRK